MKFFGKKKVNAEIGPATQVAPATASKQPFTAISNYVPLSLSEMRLYDSLREAVPVIDAAICKIVRLVGGFSAVHEDSCIQRQLNNFISNVKVNSCGIGLEAFVSSHLEQLLTYGTAIGEILADRDNLNIYALYNSSLEDVELKPTDNPLVTDICLRGLGDKRVAVKYPDLILLSALNPKPKEVYGQSILKGLPFVTNILLKIYNTIGLNWERVGNVRFAVTYRPDGDSSERAYAKERAKNIAGEWSKAMSNSDTVSDFVSVGDVSIKVIGADNQILDSQVPVRQMLEQIVAKLSIPPFLLGLSWSTTERMSSQQADILTSELESYRRTLTPVISQICSVWLRLNGYPSQHEIIWNEINLQDEVELANARLQNAKAHQMEILNKKQLEGLDLESVEN